MFTFIYSLLIIDLLPNKFWQFIIFLYLYELIILQKYVVSFAFLAKKMPFYLLVSNS